MGFPDNQSPWPSSSSFRRSNPLTLATLRLRCCLLPSSTSTTSNLLEEHQPSSVFLENSRKLWTIFKVQFQKLNGILRVLIALTMGHLQLSTYFVLDALNFCFWPALAKL
ncbi:uncharacterized protein LOC113463391 [Phoenix dactylifera]|uniref:Uncharacterized protein LOC113463391 n=1 Tax=Phoenix dactylifera TaxID=42345 RepID=A0A8B8J9Q7_PHODC|nr:uncharacterized protein LOC113463391 [Phoenix dactylifera]